MTKGNQTAVLLAAMAYQAMRQFKSGTVSLPRGYRLLTSIGSPDYPYLGYVAQSERHVVIALRGTEVLDDILKDLEVVQVPYPYVQEAGHTHKGFTDLYGRVVRPTVLEALRHLSAAKTLHLTGHSLGGALAALCALDLAANSKFRHPRLHTFGSPKIGDASFAAAFQRRVLNSARIYNEHDWIPRFPPQSILGFTYQHVDHPQPIRFERGGPLANHQIANYFRALCARHPKECNRICEGKTGLCPDGLFH